VLDAVRLLLELRLLRGHGDPLRRERDVDRLLGRERVLLVERDDELRRDADGVLPAVGLGVLHPAGVRHAVGGMRKALLIKLPSLVLAAACLAFAPPPGGWIGAGLAVGAGLVALGFVIFDANSAFWAPTLWRAPGPTNAVALTFDDGPDPDFTPRVLAILAEKNVPAAFFVVGRRVDEHPELLGAVHRAGHLVAGHSYSHDLRFHFRLRAGARRELAACNAAIARAIGREPALFRAPQGFKNPALGDVLREMGMTAVGWQVRALDAVTRSAGTILRRVVGRARAGGVIAMHDGGGLLGTRSRQPTLDALPGIIDALRASGLEFARLDALLGVEGYK
jgi:peptidoglycan/xylan/chitin deacetylase (PgdA/CDA1 family)